MNEYMDNLIPASKIAALKAGELVAQIGRKAIRNPVSAPITAKWILIRFQFSGKKDSALICQSITTLAVKMKRKQFLEKI